MNILKNLLMVTDHRERGYRPLIGEDENSSVAKNMTQDHRALYFQCAAMITGAGFEYHSGAIGGGSMPFFRKNEYLLQRIDIYVGDAGANVSYWFMPRKFVAGCDAEKTERDVARLIENARCELLLLKDVEICRYEEGAILVLGASYSRIRSVLARYVELSDAVAAMPAFCSGTTCLGGVAA